MSIKNMLSLFSRRNAVTPVVGVFLVIVVVMSVTGGVLFWGLPYVEQNRTHTQIESVYNQLNVFDSALQDLIHEGPGASRENKISIESGTITIEEDSGRLICMYSLKSGYNFTVSDIDDKDKDFTLHMISGTATKAEVFWLGLNDPQLDIIADEDVSISSNDNYLSYLKFDVSRIPSNAIIDSACIRLYIAERGENWDERIYVYSVENRWNETSSVSTFLNLEIDLSSIYTISDFDLWCESEDLSSSIYRAISNGERFCSFKVATDESNKEYTGVMQANAEHLILGNLDDGDYLKLYSCDSSKIGFRPTLVVYYHTPENLINISHPDEIFSASEDNAVDCYKYIFGTSNYIAYFKEYANSDDTVNFSKNPYSVAFQPIISNSVKGSQNYNRITYPDAFGKGIDLEYICYDSLLKENIIIKDRNSLVDLQSFNLKFKLTYDRFNISIFVDNKVWNVSNSIVGKNIELRDHFNQPVFRFAEPYAYDANSKTVDTHYTLFSENGTVYLQIDLPIAWLLDDGRVYPVVVDPTVVYTLTDANSGAYKCEKGDVTPLDPSSLYFSEFSSSEYINASYNDTSYNLWEGSNGHGNQSGFVHPSGYYGNIYYKFKINQNVFSIRSINVSWVGYDTLSNGGEFRIYIWNVSSSSWEELKRVTSSMSSDQNYTISVTSNIYNYIDSNGYLIVGIAGAKGPDNTAPNKPSTPTGETSGETDTSYTYSTSTTDPEGDDIQYGWDWDGDGTVDEWTGWYSSGDTVTVSHSWSSEGTYYVKVKAYDRDKESSWSNALAVTISSGNNPPYPPYNPSPSDGATGVSIYTDLSWSGDDPDGDPLTYDVYFGTDPTPDAGELVSSGQTATSYNPGTLSYSTTYYWKIVAHDNKGATTEGPIWSFTTESQLIIDTLRLCASSGDLNCALLSPNVVNSSNTYYNDIYTDDNNLHFGGLISTPPFYGLPNLFTPLYDIRLKCGINRSTDEFKHFSFDINYLGKAEDDEIKDGYTIDRINETHFTVYENYVAIVVSYTLNDTTPPTSRITDGPPAGGTTITYNNVTFEWTAEDDVTPTSELVYQYYLQGYDSSWKPGVNDWTSSTSTTYYNLPRGNYTFKVRAKDQAGNIETKETSLNTRSFTIIAPTETFTFSPSIGPGGSGTASLSRSLDNFVLIDLYNGNILFGRIWIVDLSSIKYSLSSSLGTYELFTENAAVIESNPGFAFVRNDPIIYSDSKSLALHIVQNIVSDSGGGGGSGVYRFSSKVLENSIRENSKVYVLKLQVYGKNDEAWRDYFTRYYDFKYSPAIIGQPYTLYYPIKDSINFILAHSIVKTNFGGVY
jgi:hypothetical protein